MNGYVMDRVICLRFPAFYVRHPERVAWVLHQHRAVYELWGTPHAGGLERTAEGRALRRHVIARDTRAFRSCRAVFANSRTVAARMAHFNGVEAKPLYHPPPLADRLYTAPAEPFIFCPSRLEGLKRQSLLIEAMAHVRGDVVALLAGEGGQRPALQRRIAELGLAAKVRLVGRLPEPEMLACYAHCLGVFFGPLDEDYGYVTLEAMLASKPVVTCRDAGGPLEFVVDAETGFVTDPDPARVAEAIDELCVSRPRAARMGEAGRARYAALGITWDNVVESLLNKTHPKSPRRARRSS
jgi:glycosyltransferase involved in cell wall biosynthesis